jgi:hypothetical protein
MDPSSTSALARILIAIKEWPLWMLTAIALSLTVFVAVPDFRQLASPVIAAGLTYATVVAWIFVAARATRPIIGAVVTYLHYRQQRRYFFVTPIDHQCLWNTTKQVDGSFVTQISVDCMIKNRSTEPLHIMKARLIRPKISGEILPGLVLTKSDTAPTYGTPHVSGSQIGAGRTLPVSCTLLIRGVPKQNAGPMPATIEIEDADGHREKVKVTLKQIGPPAM